MFSTPFIADNLDEDITDFPAKNTLTGLVVQRKKSVLINGDAFAEYIKSGEVELLGPSSEVWIGVPLFSKEKVIGVIVIQNYKGEKMLNEQDLKILEHISPQISLAIERKKSVNDLKKALEKAESSDRLKTAFMNNISHEIRTPLNGILGFAPFIIQPDISQEEKEMFLDTLNSCGERLINTVTDYMNISLIVSGNMEINPTLIDLSLLLKEVYNHFLLPCQKKNLDFKMKIPENWDHFMLKTDRELLLRCLNHLVDNAIKFTEKGFVELGFNLKTNGTQNEVEFYVKDSGKGISQDSQMLIFDVFKQEDTANTRAYEGSGLGLSIAKGVSQLLNGEIRLDSEKEKGTTVVLTLPIEGEMRSKKEKMDPSIPYVEEISSMLIAEDDDSNYHYYEAVLKGTRIKIFRAENGQEAVDLCHKHPEIQLVLMDIKMPIMNGTEATRQIKIFRTDLPVIAITAYALHGDENEILKAGFNDYLAKPFEKTKLIKLMSKYIKMS